MSTITPTIEVPTGTWDIDTARSKLGFSVRHLGISNVRGEFTEFSGGVEVADDRLASKIRATISPASIDTNDEQRDEHLRAPDFFDVGRYPEMTYESIHIDAIDPDNYRIFGELTMHGIKGEVAMVCEVTGMETDPGGAETVGLEVTGELNRGEWEMRFNQGLGSGNAMVAEKVKFTLDIVIVRQP